MYFILLLLLSITSISLLFLSNFDTRISTLIFSLYACLFILRWAKRKAYILFRIGLVLVFLMSIYAYTHNPNSWSIVTDSFAAARDNQWSEAGKKLKKVFTQCRPCQEQLAAFKKSLDNQKIKESYIEKSTSLERMSSVVREKNKDLEGAELAIHLLKKSKFELIEIKEKFNSAAERARTLRKTAGESKDLSEADDFFEKLSTEKEVNQSILHPEQN